MQLFQVTLEEWPPDSIGRSDITPLRTTVLIAAKDFHHLAQSIHKGSMQYMANELAQQITEEKVISIHRQGSVIIAPKAAATT